MSDLPRGWCWAKLGELCEIAGGLTRNQTARADGIETVLLSVAAVQRMRIDLSAVSTIKLLPEDGDRGLMEPGDLLIVEGNGSPSNIGRVAIWEGQIPGARHQNHLIRIRPRALLSRMTAYWLDSTPGKHELSSRAVSAAGLFTLSTSKLSEVPVPLAPLAEQQRIVAKLDELLARSRAAREALAAIPPLLDRYRQSVLAAALRGEARTSWSQTHLDTLVDFVTSGSRAWSKYYDRGEATFVLAGNVRDDGLDFTTRQLVDPPEGDPERRRTRIQKGDVLVTIVGANTGDCCCVQTNLKEHFVCQSVALVRPRDPADGPWIARCIQASVRGGGALARAMYGAARPHLGLDDLRLFAMPMPGPTERENTMRVVDAAFARIDAVRALVEAQRVKLDAIDRAILARAFRGELVPQDPNDEPASEMLARIRAAREAAPGKAPRRGRAHAQG